MRSRNLGGSGPTVSVVGLGGNNFGGRVDPEGTRAVVEAALDVGVNLIDTADVYGNKGGSETLLGEALKGRRERVVLATKFGGDMTSVYGPDAGARGSRSYIRRALNGSLHRLQTDWIDLYQYHWPDGVTPIEETLGALDELIKEGKVLQAGSSNLDARQVIQADEIARATGLARFISAQNEYNLLDRDIDRELIPACAKLEIGILPYFPLASGLLTGKYRRGRPPPPGSRLEGRPDNLTDQAFDTVEALERFGADRGVSLLEVAIGGLAGQPAVASVIAGATNPGQVRSNALAGDWVPSPEDLEELNRLTLLHGR